MKTNKIFKQLLLIGIAFFISNACTDDFQELNTDPAIMTADQVDVGLLLTRVQKEMTIGNSIAEGGLPGQYSGYTATSGSYPFMGGDEPTYFNRAYKNLLNLAEIIRLTQDEPAQVNKTAIARIMRAYIFQYVTDIYGDVPYTEAVKSGENVITQPKYDTQESIYKDLLKELKEAAAQLEDDNTVGYGEADLIYKGDTDKWRRFANSLRLRLALRARYVDEALAQQHIGEVLSADLMENNSHSAFVMTSTDFEANQNPIYNALFANRYYGGYMGRPIVDNLKDNDDPRLTLLVNPTVNSKLDADTTGDLSLLEYRGRALGLEQDEIELYPGNELSEIGPLYRPAVVQAPVMYYSEVCFALAEAKLFLGLGETSADVWYESGIRADMENDGIEEESITAFLDNPAVSLAGTNEEKLEQIINQKHIALFPNSFEAWAEWRRTGYPKILIGSMKGDTDGQIPRRLRYPFAEANFNSQNYQEVSNRIGGDKLLSKMWWDTNPDVPYEHLGEL